MFIVTTDHAGIPDIVEDGVNGIIMKTQKLNYNVIYNSVNSYLPKNNELVNYINENRNEIKNGYNQGEYISKMRMCFNKLV